jgi:hypothetical protein
MVVRWRYFREGKIKEIAEYCETDVVGTYQVWLRYELFRATEPECIRVERAEFIGFHEPQSDYEGTVKSMVTDALKYIPTAQ